MSEFIVSPAAEVAKCAAIPLVSQFFYIYNYRDSIRKLNEQAAVMNYHRERLQISADQAPRRGKEVFEYVNKWISGAQEKDQEAKRIIEEAQREANKRCFFGLFPNLKTRHHFGRLACKKTAELAEFVQNVPQDQQLSYTPPPLVIPDSVPEYIPSQSRSSALEEIIKELNDPDVHIIGVYGMAGVGKTTFVHQVAMKVKERNMFEVAEIVTVKPDPDLNKTRGEIAEKLGLEYKSIETEKERREVLWKKLEKIGTVLLILDDVWGNFDFHTVGIPFGEYHQGCKLILTSRSLDVLRTIRTQKNIQLGLLKDPEDWQLFEKIVGNFLEERSELHPKAREIVKACSGLPLSIVAIAGALRDREEPFEWDDALTRLKNLMHTATGPEEIKKVETGDEIEKVAYSTIKLSYQNIKSDELQLFLLLCATTANVVSTEDLLRYAKGWGFLQGIQTMTQARDRVSKLIKRLKDSCLLIENDNEEQYLVHDLVRDVGISIAYKERNMLTVRDAELEKWLSEDISKRCTSMFLWNVDFGELAEHFDYPQLIFFHLHPNPTTLKVPDNFFANMCNLRVLSLTRMKFSPQLPSSIGLLKQLRTLSLHHCLLENITILGELTKLEVLSISNSTIKQLPEELGKLTRLRLLDLQNCTQLKSFPANTISSLGKLEELYIRDIFYQWEQEQNASLSELKNLRHLTALQINVPNVKILPLDFFSMNLQQYKICIGQCWRAQDYEKESRVLKITYERNDDAAKQFEATKLLEEVEVLSLNNMIGARSICPGLIRKSFSRLKKLCVTNCSDVRFIIEAMKKVPTLETLELQGLQKLEGVCHGKCMEHTFQNLREIFVDSCPNLSECLFSVPRGGSIMKLQVVYLRNCPLQYLVKQEEAMPNDVGNDASTVLEFPELRLLRLDNLTKLISFALQPEQNQEDNTRLPLFKKISFPNLTTLKLRKICTDRIWGGVIYGFEILRELEVKRCDNLRYLLTSSMCRRLVQLKRLCISECRIMEEILLVDNCGEDKDAAIIFPQLEILYLFDLFELKNFSMGIYVDFPSLKTLKITGCKKLDSFVSSGKEVDSKEIGGTKSVEESPSSLFSGKVSFPLLESLVVWHLDNVRTIWDNQPSVDSFYNLKELYIKNCRNLESVIPFNMARRFSALTTLHIWDCDSLIDLVGKWPCGEYVESQEQFEKLRKITIEQCPILKIVFPAFMAKNLKELVELRIWSCEALEGIVAANEEGEVEIRSYFPRAKTVELYELPKVRYPITLDRQVIFKNEDSEVEARNKDSEEE